jgi:hypothetical protein
MTATSSIVANAGLPSRASRIWHGMAIGVILMLLAAALTWGFRF